MAGRGRWTAGHVVEGAGTLLSVSVMVLAVTGVSVPPLPGAAYVVATLLYVGGLLTGYGLSLER